MHLTILLPFAVFADVDAVLNIVAETPAGAFGLLPRRLDCAAALTPGILSYVTAAGETHVAVDQGTLVKTGAHVLVSVRRACAGVDLAELRARVEREFLALDARERDVRRVMAKLESGLLHRMASLQHE
jgi:F-type H+-transporting ATPase subunit epsilon